MRLLFVLAVASPVFFSLAAGMGCSSTGTGGGGATATDDAGSDAETATCSDVLPAACPAPEPSYQTDVLPIVEQRCYACHADAGIATSGSGIDLGSYDAIDKLSSDVGSEVNGCRMPPAGSPQPTSAERATLLGWVVCGAPDN